jgi:hypothetical protein
MRLRSLSKFFSDFVSNYLPRHCLHTTGIVFSAPVLHFGKVGIAGFEVGRMNRCLETLDE